MGWDLVDFDYFEVVFGCIVVWVCLGIWYVFLVCIWGDVFFWEVKCFVVDEVINNVYLFV